MANILERVNRGYSHTLRPRATTTSTMKNIKFALLDDSVNDDKFIKSNKKKREEEENITKINTN